MQELLSSHRVLVVAAHPDDEVIGAGGILPHLREVFIVHTTDGSPRDPADALRSGFATREDYAAARRRELACALRLAGITETNVWPLGFTDQETMRCLPDLCRALAEVLVQLQPDAILTQPYEGGHPDHDSTAFAASRAAGDSRRLFEMTSYHSYQGVFRTGQFLPNGEPDAVTEPSPEDATRKRRMLECFRSQESVLQAFPVGPERFRRAPRYDFARPPHQGALHYESLPWGITGEAWRKLAAQCG